MNTNSSTLDICRVSRPVFATDLDRTDCKQHESHILDSEASYKDSAVVRQLGCFTHHSLAFCLTLIRSLVQQTFSCCASTNRWQRGAQLLRMSCARPSCNQVKGSPCWGEKWASWQYWSWWCQLAVLELCAQPDPIPHQTCRKEHLA